MDEKTLIALKGSIKKWEGILKGIRHNLGMHDCPLCKLFNNARYSCNGCPVKERVNRTYCEGTPYYDFMYGERKYGISSKKYKKLAQKELDFLKSLLPKKVKVRK